MNGAMRIFVHDYGGHPFPVQLSRELAHRGHTVHHLYAPFFQSPKGGLTKTAADPDGLSIEALDIGEPFQKYRFVPRLRQEIRYGHLAAERVRAFRPDVAIGCTIPLDPQNIYLRACKEIGAPHTYWLQDFYSTAISWILRRKFPGLGHLVGWRYTALERRMIRDSAAVVAITEDFLPHLREWGVDPARTHVIENWAPIEDLPVLDRETAWRAEHGLSGKRVALYSGTLGMKHNPALLLALAERCADRPDIAIVVNSEGPGEEWLRREGAARGLGNLVMLPFQPYERFPEVLASADVLVAILEPDAGVFSVPSKVLSYLCAARPVLAAIPPENLAARILTGKDAGRVTPPHDVEAFVANAETLLADAGLRETLGRNARDYAESRFRIKDIGERFETILSATRRG